jgi:serine/threonine protein kinase
MKDGNQVVLIDFGFAQRVDEEIKRCGTPGCIAPEVYYGQKIGTAADIYSFGVVLGQLLANYLPGIDLQHLGSQFMRSSTTNSICLKIEDARYDILNDWKPILFDAADLIYQMLQEDPAARITANQILNHNFVNSSKNVFEEYQSTTYTSTVLSKPRSQHFTQRREPKVIFRGY